jgi:SMI1-KNR4 cell-wall
MTGDTIPSELSSEQADCYGAVLKILSSHKHLGVKKFEDGSVAIGRLPQVAELAYLHRLFSPLSEEQLDALQDELEYNFPKSLRSFFLMHNGVGFFSDELNIYGQRLNWQRSNIEAALQQPYSIQSGNIDKMPKWASNDPLVIGSVGPERSPITMDKNGHVSIWKKVSSRSPATTYPEFFEFLLSEVQKLSKTVDRNGSSVEIQYH